MGLDDLVYLRHKADGFRERDNDLLVAGDVVLRETAAPAVLEPLLADLVPTDIIVSAVLAHTLEADTQLPYPSGHGRRGLAGAGVGGDDDRRWCTDPAPSVSHARHPGHCSDGRRMIST